MGDSESPGFLAAVQIVGAQLTETNLLPLGDRDLGDQATEDELPGRVDPVRRQRGDHLAPNPLFEGIQIRGRLRATLSRHQRDDG
jgi:hypothetical protein